MSQWYQQHEQSAGKIRLNILWLVYKILGLRGLKIFLHVLVFFIWMAARPARQASDAYRNILNAYEKTNTLPLSKFNSYTHILSYAKALADKIDALSGGSHLTIEPEKNQDWADFESYMKQNIGVFLICSHVGNIEAFAAFHNAAKTPDKTMHAFMHVTQNKIFHDFLTAKMTAKNVKLHATQNISMTTAMQMYEYLQSGDLVMMAGDRIAADNPSATTHTVLFGRDILLPVGVFKFARLMQTPVFAINCMNTGGEKYCVRLKRLDMKDIREATKQYTAFLQKNALDFPKQWYHFYMFFPHRD